MVSDEDTANAAEAVCKAMESEAFGPGDWFDVYRRRDAYLGAVRREFNLPPIPLIEEP